MPYVIGQPKLIAVEFAGENIYFKLREPTTKETMDYLNDRMPMVAGKITSNITQAGLEFVDKILEDVEGLEYVEKGKNVILNNQVKNWKSMIPPHLKSAVATKFHDVNAEMVQGARPT